LLSGSLTLISCVNFDQTRAVVAYSLFVLPPTAATRYAFAVMLLVRKRLTATFSVPDVIARQSGADRWLGLESVAICRVSNQFSAQG
jgi:hypothetical protein